MASALGLDQPTPEKSTSQESSTGYFWNFTYHQDFFEDFGMVILDNVQVFVENIHIRYQDNITCPTTPFVTGFVIQDLHVQSTDSNWVPKFTAIQQEIMYKVGLKRIYFLSIL